MKKFVISGILILTIMIPQMANAQCQNWLDFQCWRSKPAFEWRTVVPFTVNQKIDSYLAAAFYGPARVQQENINIGYCICGIYSIPEEGCSEELLLEEYFFCLPEAVQQFILMFYEACP